MSVDDRPGRALFSLWEVSFAQRVAQSPLSVEVEKKVDADDVQALVKEARASIMHVRKVRHVQLTKPTYHSSVT